MACASRLLRVARATGVALLFASSAPAQSFDYEVRVRVTSAALGDPEAPGIALAPFAVPSWTRNETGRLFDFATLATVSGSPAPVIGDFTWSIVNGALLPDGLVLDADGVLAGTPTAKGEADIEVQAASGSLSARRTYQIVVNGLPLSIVQISAGFFHTCAVTDAGAAKCWGGNAYGQLGDNSKLSRLAPVTPVGLSSGVAEVSVGQYHSCARLTSGAVQCWGSNSAGQIGDATTTERLVPTLVPGMVASQISAGMNHTCATVSGAAKCWGLNSSGQLGDGTLSDSVSPVDVSGLATGVARIAAGSGHSCAIQSGGLKCWGANVHGQLGNGDFTQSGVAVDVTGLASSVSSVSAGDTHVCAIQSGALWCWGNNADGKLGDGTSTTRSAPVGVPGLGTGVASVSASFDHTCASTLSGEALCWGKNASQQLGDGTTSSRSAPAAVSGLSTDVVDLSAGALHSCAATSSGTAKCWGANASGQLGDDTTAPRATPVDVVLTE